MQFWKQSQIFFKKISKYFNGILEKDVLLGGGVRKMTMSQLSLGQRIRYYRTKAGLSQKALAASVGLSPTVLSRYEADKLEPNVLTLMNIAKVLKITVDALVGLEPRPDLIAQNSDEALLLRLFRQLNDVGRGRVLEYSSVLSVSPQHTDSAKK
jgi:transcriptional regulator with XRE-family HTH domain